MGRALPKLLQTRRGVGREQRNGLAERINAADGIDRPTRPIGLGQRIGCTGKRLDIDVCQPGCFGQQLKRFCQTSQCIRQKLAVICILILRDGIVHPHILQLRGCKQRREIIQHGFQFFRSGIESNVGEIQGIQALGGDAQRRKVVLQIRKNAVEYLLNLSSHGRVNIIVHTHMLGRG